MDYMKRALVLARRVQGKTRPNPPVGAVVVRDGVIVGEGATRPAGLWHAEVVALNRAGESARGAALYVSLEPCCHLGRTPPCTQAIIVAGITQVHMAILDPNPLVSGRGKAQLEAAGIETHLGERAQEAQEGIEFHAKFSNTGLPFVIAKFAASLDGKIATRAGHSRWITGPQARDYIHRVREQVDAIMVGVSTVLADDPSLTARYPSGSPRPKQPLRVIVDSRARISPSAKVLQPPGEAVVAVTSAADPERIAALSQAGAQVETFPDRDLMVDLEALLNALGQREVTSLLVEGGGTLLGSFFDLRLVDKVMAFLSPVIIGGEAAVSAVGGTGAEKLSNAFRLSKMKVRRLGQDLLVVGYPRQKTESALGGEGKP